MGLVKFIIECYQRTDRFIRDLGDDFIRVGIAGLFGTFGLAIGLFIGSWTGAIACVIAAIVFLVTPTDDPLRYWRPLLWWIGRGLLRLVKNNHHTGSAYWACVDWRLNKRRS